MAGKMEGQKETETQRDREAVVRTECKKVKKGRDVDGQRDRGEEGGRGKGARQAGERKVEGKSREGSPPYPRAPPGWLRSSGKLALPPSRAVLDPSCLCSPFPLGKRLKGSRNPSRLPFQPQRPG